MNVPLTPLRFLRHAEHHFGCRTAVVCGAHRFTYAEFGDRAARLGGALVRLGARPGDRVAFLSGNCHRLLEAYYGVLEAGAVLLPVNVRLRPAELAFILNDSEASILLCQPELMALAAEVRSRAPGLRAIVPLDGTGESYESLLQAAQPLRRDVMEVDENAVAELFYTSGTSADPKGVMLSHRNIYLHALNVAISFEAPAQPVHLHTIPLFHANGWGTAHTVTLAGGKHVMISRYDCGELLTLIEAEGVKSFSLVPAMALALLNSEHLGRHDLRSLQWISMGGAASWPSLLKAMERAFGCSCFSGYGLTETSPVVALSRSELGEERAEGARYEFQASTGTAILGSELRVVDSSDHDVPPDGATVGEIIARGDGIMSGYWKQPQATAEAMRGGWFHTGDLAVVKPEGHLLIVDRKKDIIISGGENVSSLEVERALVEHPAVGEAAVIA
ncbi:MAG: AMP-binding protein, partial [Acidobacteria bacterium]|nr:AMP-binding protein [Acidobacteriota bacterium]